VQLNAEHLFPFAPDSVIDAMVDPSFASELAGLPDVGTVEVVDDGTQGTTRWISMRMTYDGSLDPLAARVLGSSSPSWIQTYRLDAAAGSGHLSISPEHHESLLRCHAELRFTPTSEGTRRSMRGDLSVRVPLVGGRAERALAPAIVSRIDVEAELLAGWLSERG
jgi:hypothetical protein